MSRLQGGLHGLKADPSACTDDQDFRHGVMLPVGPAWLTVMCDVGSRTARWARRFETHEGLVAGVRPGVGVPAMRQGGGAASVALAAASKQPVQLIRSPRRRGRAVSAAHRSGAPER